MSSSAGPTHTTSDIVHDTIEDTCSEYDLYRSQTEGSYLSFAEWRISTQMSENLYYRAAEVSSSDEPEESTVNPNDNNCLIPPTNTTTEANADTVADQHTQQPKSTSSKVAKNKSRKPTAPDRTLTLRPRTSAQLKPYTHMAKEKKDAKEARKVLKDVREARGAAAKTLSKRKLENEGSSPERPKTTRRHGLIAYGPKLGKKSEASGT
ncbi:hypothetical protein K432DRAFT_424162 [Lepidopterella palustris CBS 459.81]|uniref:Uncharacterized protein n=1 Tax=Lepidopterella palustris CBS 459.81 TaxID=1314670 RepID=A0A8E2EEL8_9PEZI|nr:hypothetical protein K432DRAFT_424162 [Lepidopterella palustris CBS 459.81]